MKYVSNITDENNSYILLPIEESQNVNEIPFTTAVSFLDSTAMKKIYELWVSLT
jgi:hypothetical protein